MEREEVSLTEEEMREIEEVKTRRERKVHRDSSQ